MAHLLQISTPSTVENCANFIVDLKGAIGDLLAEFEEVNRARHLADTSVSELRLMVDDLETSRGHLLATLNKQKEALEFNARERVRLYEMLQQQQVHIDTLTTRLQMSVGEKVRLKHMCDYADKVLTTSVSAAEHMGAVYGVGAGLMKYMLLPAPPAASELLARILHEQSCVEEDDASVEEASVTGTVSDHESNEAYAHAHARKDEREEGARCATAAALAVLHEED